MKTALLFSEDYLGSYPSLINAIYYLQDRHEEVNIIGFEFQTNFPPPPKFGKNVKFYLKKRHDRIDRDYNLNSNSDYNYEFNEQYYIKKILNKLIPSSIIILFRYVRNILRENLFYTFKYQINTFLLYFKLFSNLFHCSKKNHYNSVIAVDSFCLIVCYLHKFFFQKDYKIYFWSLEISIFSRYILIDMLLSFIEKKAVSFTDYIIIQSVERLSTLHKLSNTCIDISKFIEVPHSRSFSNISNRNNFFNENFNLSNSKIIILHLGWIHDVMDSFNLSKSTLNWPENIHLILHERMKRDILDDYISKILKLNSLNITLSLNPVDYNELDYLISSSDIGIVIYNTEGYGSMWDNIEKASGKIADYLALGKPVICSNFEGFRKLLESYHCGFIFEDLQDIPSLITRIVSDYDNISANALKCFKSEFEFNKFFSKVDKSMLGLSYNDRIY